MEALRQRRRAGRADRPDRERSRRSITSTRRAVRRPTTSRRRRASCTTSRSAGSRSPKRRAPRRRRCGIATARPPIRSRPRRASSSPSRSEERKANLDRKLALIERAEALAESTDWIKTAEELKTLQQEWQQIGAGAAHRHARHLEALPRGLRQVLHPPQRRSRASARKPGRPTSPRRKRCAPAPRSSPTSREWDRAAAEIRRLQAEWKTIGPVRRNKSEVIWQRFRAAARHLLRALQASRRDRPRGQAGGSRGAHHRARTARRAGRRRRRRRPPPICSNACARCARAGTRRSSVVRHGADPLSERFVAALERVMVSHPDQFRGTELDAEASRQKMEKLVAKVEGFLVGGAAGRRPTPRRRWPTCCARRSPPTPSAAAAATKAAGGRWATTCGRRRRHGAGSAPVPGQAGRELTERFHRASNRFIEQYRRRVPPTPQSGPGGRPRKELQTR